MTSHHIDTGTGHLKARLDDGVFTVTLHRPEARNALTLEMLEALSAQLAFAETSADVRCVVLTGAGKGFCAGGDLKAMAVSNDAGGSRSVDTDIHLQRLIQRSTAGKLFAMPKPTIAAINGPAAGAGLALALACDLRLMSSDTILVTAFAKAGLPGDFGGSYFMTQLLGAAKARELYYLSERIDADEAVRLGLANWACAPDQLESRTMSLAARLAAGPSVAYRYMKENLNRAMGGSVDDCLDLEATHHVHCTTTGDHQEAAKAFTEKREPVFTGR